MLGSITGLAFGFASVVSKSSTVCSVSITAITVFLLLSLSEVQGGTPEVAGGESGNPATDEPWRKGLEDLGFTPSLEWDADVLIDARGGIKQAAVAGGLIRLLWILTATSLPVQPF